MIGALILLFGVAIGASAPSHDRVPVGGGRHIALHCQGVGGPTVILTAGLGDGAESWSAIQPDLGKFARACAWDRAGNGQSDPSSEPQDAVHTTADLETALKAGRIAPPYILVGHSIGSFETLLFAFRHPADVAAIVLVDPSSPFQGRRFAEASPKFGLFNARRLAERDARLRRCVAALRSATNVSRDCGDDPDDSPVAARIARAESAVSMSENMEASSAQITSATRPLGAIPLIVLTAGDRASLPPDIASEEQKVRAAWSAMHDDLTRLSSRGEHRHVQNAAHYVHQDRPDVVVAAICDALLAVRKTPADERLAQSSKCRASAE